MIYFVKLSWNTKTKRIDFHLTISLSHRFFRLRRATFDLGEARDETRQGFPHKGENSVVPTSGGREMMKLYEIVRSLEYYL